MQQLSSPETVASSNKAALCFRCCQHIYFANHGWHCLKVKIVQPQCRRVAYLTSAQPQGLITLPGIGLWQAAQH